MEVCFELFLSQFSYHIKNSYRYDDKIVLRLQIHFLYFIKGSEYLHDVFHFLNFSL
jgi:hypothetical protein